MDGLSQDNTVNLVKKYNDSRIRIYSEKDLGIYDAMNKGVKIALGKWLYFLGSDDALFDRDVLMKIAQIKILPSTLLLYGKALIVPDNFITSSPVSFYQLTKFNLCHQAIFYSKNVFTKYRYDIRFKMLADWDLNLKIFSRYPDRVIATDVLVCKFYNLGISSNWRESTEFKNSFSDLQSLRWRYKKSCKNFMLFVGSRIKKITQLSNSK
jgi:glycosyltransferase involved in cell wall biosynthesis